MTETIRRVCVFCGSSPGKRRAYRDAAHAVGHLLAERSIDLIYGGARVGLMGAVADATLNGGGRVTGVITHSLADIVAHPRLDLERVRTMHERKARFAELADAFIALPGGLGTFEEFFEMVTWNQLGIHDKPVGLLNIDGFYDPLLALLDHAVEERFIKAPHRDAIVVATTPRALLDQVMEHENPKVLKWIDSDDS